MSIAGPSKRGHLLGELRRSGSDDADWQSTDVTAKPTALFRRLSILKANESLLEHQRVSESQKSHFVPSRFAASSSSVASDTDWDKST